MAGAGIGPGGAVPDGGVQGHGLGRERRAHGRRPHHLPDRGLVHVESVPSSRQQHPKQCQCAAGTMTNYLNLIDDQAQQGQKDADAEPKFQI